jgi:hypothetical protein
VVVRALYFPDVASGYAPAQAASGCDAARYANDRGCHVPGWDLTRYAVDRALL